MRGLAGKRVLITGAATGIGRAAAIRFAEEGAGVAVNFIGDAEPAEALIEELNRIHPEGGHVLAPADVWRKVRLSVEAGTLKHPVSYATYVDDSFAKAGQPALIAL